MNTIVILGGGYAGIRCGLSLARQLPKDYQIILVNKGAFHVPQSMLYEFATTAMEEDSFPLLKETACFSLKQIFKDTSVQLMEKEVSDVFLKDQLVAFSDMTNVRFDYCVFALGSETNYFDIPGLREYAFGLKDFNEAMNIRGRIAELFSSHKGNKTISIVIGGGGFTGVELAGELAHFIKKLCTEYAIAASACSVTVLEASGTVLPGANPRVQKKAKSHLESLGVSVIVNHAVERYDGKEITMKNGETVTSDMLIWTAGVRGNSLLERTKAPLQKSCLPVNEYLQISGLPNVFGAGDSTMCIDPKTERPVPLTAQAALDQGKAVAENIIRSIEKKQLIPFQARRPFFVVPIGGKYAIADLHAFVLEGFIAWVLKMLVWLKYLVSILPIGYGLKIWIKGLRIFIAND
jgi:NADH dehydrogenase